MIEILVMDFQIRAAKYTAQDRSASSILFWAAAEPTAEFTDRRGPDNADLLLDPMMLAIQEAES